MAVRQDTNSSGNVLDRDRQLRIATTSTDVLRRVVEQHIVPRLVLSHPDDHVETSGNRCISGRIDRLADIALHSDDTQSRSMLSELHDDGVDHDALQLGLIAPAAERLGMLWSDDQIDFLDVTIATNSLIRSMRFVSLELERLPRSESGDAAILIAAAPGDTHTLGAAMAAEFFRRAGWQVVAPIDATEQDLVLELGRQSFDVLGLSLVSDFSHERLSAYIERLRRASKNPGLIVIVGGPAFSKDPSLVTLIGADAAIAAIERAPEQTRRVMHAIKELR